MTRSSRLQQWQLDTDTDDTEDDPAKWRMSMKDNEENEEGKRYRLRNRAHLFWAVHEDATLRLYSLNRMARAGQLAAI